MRFYYSFAVGDTLTTSTARNNKAVHVAGTLTTQAAAFSTGDIVCGCMKLSNVVEQTKKGGVIKTIMLADEASQSTVTYDLLLFDGPPSATTFTINSALDIADADLPNLIGKAVLPAGTAMTDNSFTFVTPDLWFQMEQAVDMYAVLIARTNAPTYAATDDLRIVFVIERH